jgi:hypothetical protein
MLGNPASDMHVCAQRQSVDSSICCQINILKNRSQAPVAECLAQGEQLFLITMTKNGSEKSTGIQLSGGAVTGAQA